MLRDGRDQNFLLGTAIQCHQKSWPEDFQELRVLHLKGSQDFLTFNMLPRDWGANVHSWLVMFAKVYPFLEELRLKRMTVTDESLELLAKSFPGFKALTLSSCDGFSDNGLKAIASNCRLSMIFSTKLNLFFL
ncbi:UNVERIFIED_CONTAM: protein TRANSPORT INHIBITOR RESPONSE 1 [Sesamum radiatum]|uniref:Protein TRANSPORT INHIBITOR RESPONSE 1 n=1 Tax=Sesamum radiatum TaxID=300843 RepID=A0AAW2KH34_SESRA